VDTLNSSTPQFLINGSQGRNQEAGADAEVMRCAIYWLAPQGLLSLLSFFFFFFFFWFFFSELGTEPRALRFLGKRSTTELNPQPLSLLS